jgi:hypothetical protein
MILLDFFFATAPPGEVCRDVEMEDNASRHLYCSLILGRVE